MTRTTDSTEGREFKKLAEWSPRKGDVFENEFGTRIFADTSTTARGEAWGADSVSEPFSSFCMNYTLVSRADGWSEWSENYSWDTSTHDVQMECIDGIHRVRTRPRKPKRVTYWVNVYPDFSGDRGCISRAAADRNATSDRLAVFRIEYDENGDNPTITKEDV